MKPDSCWCWLVVAAAWSINVLMAGLVRSSGIMYIAFMETFYVDRAGAALPSSVRSAMVNLCGPVVGILGQKYGVRAVVFSGSLVGAMSGVACFFSNNIMQLTISWGIFNGIATAMIVYLPLVIVGQYFVKYRTTAIGLSVSGGGMGSFIFPTFLEFLLDYFGLSGTFLIIGGIILNTAIAAMILRKPPWKKNIPEKTRDGESNVKYVAKTVILSAADLVQKEEKMTHETACENNCTFVQEGEPNICYLKVNIDMIVRIFSILCNEPQSIEISKTYSYVKQQMEELYLYYAMHSEQLKLNIESESVIQSEIRTHCNNYRSFHKPKQYKSHNPYGMFRNASVPNIIYDEPDLSNNYALLIIQKISRIQDDYFKNHFSENNMHHVLNIIHELRKLYSKIKGIKTIKDIGATSESEIRYSITSSDLVTLNSGIGTLNKEGIYSEVPKTTESAVSLSNGHPNNTTSDVVHRNTLSNHFKSALKLNLNPMFLLICLSRCVYFINFLPIMTGIVDFAMDKGIQREDGKFAIATFAIGDLVGRLGLGWVTDKGYLSLPRFLTIWMCLQGLCTAILPMVNSKATLFLAFAIFALVQGSLFVRHPVLVTKYMGTHVQSIAMGSVNFYSGLLALIMPNYIGYFRDYIGSYDCIFYINGSISMIAGLIWYFEPILHKHSLHL